MDRTRLVEVKGVYSETRKFKSSVVQGSCFGPVFFLVLVNDLIDTTHNAVEEVLNQRKEEIQPSRKNYPVETGLQCFLFADDAKFLLDMRDDTDDLSRAKKKETLIITRPRLQTIAIGLLTFIKIF